MAKLERDFEAGVNAKIQERLPGAIIIKGNSRYRQGIPDRLILYKDRWALLEYKRSERDAEPKNLQPNQEYYRNLFNDMSYAAFIYPENEEDILDGLQRALQDPR